MSETVELAKERLDVLVSEIARGVAKRTQLTKKMDEEISRVVTRYRPELDLQDKAIKSGVDEITAIVSANFANLFKKSRTLNLTSGTITIRRVAPTYKVIDMPGLIKLLRRYGKLNAIAPAARKVVITELKKFEDILNVAIAKHFVTSTGGGDVLTVKPNSADATGTPSLSRAIKP